MKRSISSLLLALAVPATMNWAESSASGAVLYDNHMTAAAASDPEWVTIDTWNPGFVLPTTSDVGWLAEWRGTHGAPKDSIALMHLQAPTGELFTDVDIVVRAGVQLNPEGTRGRFQIIASPDSTFGDANDAASAVIGVGTVQFNVTNVFLDLTSNPAFQNVSDIYLRFVGKCQLVDQNDCYMERVTVNGETFVPEPASLTCLTSGLLLSLRRRARRSALQG